MLARDDLTVWLINLEQNTERRAAMETQLSRFGLTARVFAAIDGRARAAELSRRVDAAAYRRSMGLPILPGKMGVFASHLAVWDLVAASGAKVALILEDDTVFHDDFPDALDTALALSGHWDIVRFNAVRAKLPVTQLRAGGYRLNAYVGPFTGNACYLIRADLARRLGPSLWPQTRALDHELNRFFRHDYRQMGLEPFASHTDDGGTSTITGTHFNLVAKPHWLRRLPHFAVKIGNYLRRTLWLWRKGMLFPKAHDVHLPGRTE
jgi:glycosyl transferase, family 25